MADPCPRCNQPLGSNRADCWECFVRTLPVPPVSDVEREALDAAAAWGEVQENAGISAAQFEVARLRMNEAALALWQARKAK